MWGWLVNGNPVVQRLLAELELAKDETAGLPQALERMVRERAGGKGTAVLTSPVNIGAPYCGGRRHGEPDVLSRFRGNISSKRLEKGKASSFHYRRRDRRPATRRPSS
jgi:hypothetical protein